MATKPRDVAEEPNLERSDRRRDVLRILETTAPEAVGIAAIADELAVHPNTVRFHLNTLVSDGRVERVVSDRRQPGRPPLEFRAIPQTDAEPRQYRMLAEILTTSLAGQRAARDKALAAGQAWGRGLEPPASESTRPNSTEAIDGLVGLLDAFGFAPEPRESADDNQIRLRHCPFLELAEHHKQVVCPIHLGLMRGALERWDAPIAVERLDAFVEPDLCVAHLTSIGSVA